MICGRFSTLSYVGESKRYPPSWISNTGSQHERYYLYVYLTNEYFPQIRDMREGGMYTYNT